MPINIDYTPVAGVAELARRGGQQQQAVREQGFQFQQDLIGLQANLQQKRDVMLNQFQQSRDVQLQQYETEQLNRRYSFLRSQARKDRKHQEELAELEIEQYKEREKFDIKLENEQYVAKRQFDFDLGLEAQRNEFMFESQMEQQKTMADQAEQQQKAQQEEREVQAVKKAIYDNKWLSEEEADRAWLNEQTRRSLPNKPSVGISTEALQLAASMGIPPQLAQDGISFTKTLPNDLVPLYWDGLRNPQRRQDFMKVYEQRLSEEYGLIPNREQIVKQRMDETDAPRQIAADDQLFEQWENLGWPRNQAMLGLAAGIKAYAKSQVAPDKEKEFDRALDDFITTSRKLEEATMKGMMTETVTGKKSKVVKALELKRDRVLVRMRKIDPVLTQNILSQVEQAQTDYDYEGAKAEGFGPDETGHWDSKFKPDDSPERYIDGLDTKTASLSDIITTYTRLAKEELGSNTTPSKIAKKAKEMAKAKGWKIPTASTNREIRQKEFRKDFPDMALRWDRNEKEIRKKFLLMMDRIEAANDKKAKETVENMLAWGYMWGDIVETPMSILEKYLK